MRNILIWHALEESEHKAVAFDVYRAVGGTERRRINTMRYMRASFILGTTIQVILSLLSDPAARQRGALRASLRRLKSSPFLQPEIWRRLKEYDQPGFHPDDRDTHGLVEQWRHAVRPRRNAQRPPHGGGGMKGRSNVEHLDVLVMGAGLSGIAAGHYIQSDCPWASYAIFESRDVIGGTWDLFRYPGVRSDSDMYTLGYSFRPWDNPYAIAEGEWIRQYLVDTAKEEGIDAHIRFGHKVLSAAWSSDDACWHVKALRTDSGEEFELTCGFLFSCAGYYRYDQGYQPEFPGLDTFEGTFVHPQAWPSALDTGNKTVVVIGSGATAVTLVPSLAKTADRG